jgi:hypothetical protein
VRRCRLPWPIWVVCCRVFAALPRGHGGSGLE